MPGKDFPYNKPIESEAEMFIQWKGTDVCMDFYCPCGHHMHIDADFVYFVKCGSCGSIYQMGTQVIAKRVSESYAKSGVHLGE